MDETHRAHPHVRGHFHSYHDHLLYLLPYLLAALFAHVIRSCVPVGPD